MQRIRQYFILVLSAICFVQSSIGQEPTTAKPSLPVAEMITVRVHVVDPDDIPLADAIVFPSGLRSRVERASHYGWRPEFGELPQIKTDKNGIAEVPYPKYIFEKVETGTVTWSVEHPDFVPFREDRDVNDDPAEIKMKRGYRIAVTAVVAESGENISDDLFAIMCGFDNRQWKLHENGTLVSPIFSIQKNRLRIVRVAEGQPTLFSSLIDVEAEGESRVFLKNVKLSKGIRIEGKLDPQVPRPISNGVVVAAACRRTAVRAYETQWQWTDSVKIAEDGTFVFESFPSDEVVQLLPYCDGWLPTKPGKEIVARHFPADGLRLREVPMTIPQIYEPTGELLSLTAAMEASTSVRIIVRDPDGKPLPDAIVQTTPNHVWFQGSGGILGMVRSKRENLLKTGDQKTMRKFAVDEMPYSARSDKDGIAMIENLPVSRHSLNIWHKDFVMPISNRRRRSLQVVLSAGEVVEVTVNMQEKGTEVLDEKTR